MKQTKTDKKMKKEIKFRRATLIVAASVLALTAASCKKSESAGPSAPSEGVRVFGASVESPASDGKTYLDGLFVKWERGDLVKVFSTVSPTSGKYQTNSLGSPTTELTAVDDANKVGSGGTYYAIYPYDKAGTNSVAEGKLSGVTIPRVQDYRENSFASGANVMAATSGSEDFHFKNLCGVLRLTLTGDETVYGIRVTDKNGNKVSGPGTVSFNGGSEVSPCSITINEATGYNEVCLKCLDEDGNGVKLNTEGVVFNIVVGPGSFAGGLDMYVYTDKGVSHSSTSKDNKVEQNKVLTMPATGVEGQVEPLSGKFSVGNDGHKVKFSKGNLYYNGAVFMFEDNQYDYRTYVGKEACIGGDKTIKTPAGHWGTFGWAEEGSATAKMYGMSTNTSNSNYGTNPNGNLQDWGQATHGYSRLGWRTLSSGEWSSVLNGISGDGSTRPTGNSSLRYAKATVNGVAGLLFFPDNTITVTENNSANFQGVNIANANQGNGTFNTISNGNWTTLEGKGVVFLPCDGWRSGTVINSVGSIGYCWSSTVRSNTNAYSLCFDLSGVYPASSSHRSNGFSVRLVCDCK